ncbi:7,8-dihydropterin-6-yl-methyl-4-(beta-D-ribofuranosyl)aminobenzene 5'-phosphate synthase [Methanohalophilus euhalobius]|uniref:7, 8-dihydropterin-6-yl-methyl-4-(Beta-D-ribofuranosyl)aminobenzene 5'-phosphate synthase n=1 Tax=Methanohalophilus euhalobius TaxID=51203 RepID=A0A285FXE0_9EURY|nr:MAG: beta-lactamase [Methanohalophilus sp. 2-GBenrich]RSD34732.1 MAG: beta-lactamase [Methanohalophilus sp.]TCL11674.1 7,8-dihydropterin-6-yl-methyl-4-(beta-D-ribofuranosyl)aminobenzene 5'-phosphate synthase [Methanohalophilus euhalobius]SNY15937.1 7,8-dihydropterin-6-yl-methyl-4-(beta-D-ribofuranosyl)aminobenzene 5'-phosphate synthase [Methanohalophilus euhalobius]
MNLELTVVYDNNAAEDFHAGWGFACLIQQEDTTLLFDTGWNGPALLENLKKVGIKPSDIDILILSHQHWDHIGGLSAILHNSDALEVYVPRAFSPNLKKEIARHAQLIEITKSRQVCKGVFTTGQLGNHIKEQSLVLQSEDGLYIITGCAHPGLGEIIDNAAKMGHVTGVLGGLHDFNDMGTLGQLSYIAAGHCTSHNDEIKRKYPEKFAYIYAGYSVDI